ncbi:MAG: sigma-54 dependent transcriptional regulator [Bacteroidota bacterium]|nr:sigma-54 dependent transcriptional regulator [Bacteroidota bacterium]
MSNKEENRNIENGLKHEIGIHGILGKSEAIQNVHENIKIASESSNETVLIIGETGTGKELVARSVHLHSTRSKNPYIVINCSAIPSTLVESELFGHERGAFTGATELRKGKFELANHGTLFLDEIAEMPVDIQPKLLRVLEDRKFYRIGSSVEQMVDVRVVAASSKDLRKVIAEGKFREDLFYRLNVIPIYLPPLRERQDDIPLLAQSFLGEFTNSTKNFTKDAIDLLKSMAWKGNVRELKNLVKSLSLFIKNPEINANDIKRIHLSTDMDGVSNLGLMLKQLIQSNAGQTNLFENIGEQIAELALHLTNGKVTTAAQMLGIDRNALQRRIQKYKLTTLNPSIPVVVNNSS